jgi:hypothetical protein
MMLKYIFYVFYYIRVFIFYFNFKLCQIFDNNKKQILNAIEFDLWCLIK